MAEFEPERAQDMARMAQLPFTEEEAQKYMGQLKGIFDAFEVLKSFDTTGVEPYDHIGLKNVMDGDVVQPSLTQEEVLKQAPETHGGFIRIKRVRE